MTPATPLDPLPARLRHFALQSAHRAFAVAFWLFVARLAVLAFRPMPWTRYLLPATIGLLCLAALVSLGVLYLSRRRPEQFDEARELVLASSVLLALTLTWALATSP